MGKSEDTRQHILSVALNIATASSLNDLSIGTLAAATNMSKSGLFAHFKSKENLQLAVLDHANAVFRRTVIEPSSVINSPLQRLLKICELWLDWYQQQAQNCIFIAAAVEFDDQPGPIHDKVSQDLARWLNHLNSTVKAAIEVGEFKSSLDAEQFVYELYSLYLGSQNMTWLGIEDSKHSRFQIALNGLISRSKE
ncbi:TetR/AcrR family transcriptional regulator [Pseudoalteromonas tunicata]|uniref:TetR/AcrR family transcriptional regulator n=1 Tax=Pseudoalteromonas tunicata TaxID=314281 RepID=UPI00273F3B8A|nr:TetR/AcrR family transcriptional regulator [Pseudoalteromonas tunicata]MDP4983732.1 TetR/AcrR family transcriptional regulator [Pseudoalteromonas tunicata]MDP5214298.1 TetR/AcrR family transcriptional regulator [Pseudoalteromonas tunicata]